MMIFKTRNTIDNSVAYWADELPSHDLYTRIEGQVYFPINKENVDLAQLPNYYGCGMIVV